MGVHGVYDLEYMGDVQGREQFSPNCNLIVGQQLVVGGLVGRGKNS